MRRRFGVVPQVSIRDQVVWFEWKNRDDALELAKVAATVDDGGLNVARMVLIGTFEVDDNFLRAPGYVISTLVTLEKELSSVSQVSVEISDWEKGSPAATETPPVEPKVYQP